MPIVVAFLCPLSGPIESVAATDNTCVRTLRLQILQFLVSNAQTVVGAIWTVARGWAIRQAKATPGHAVSTGPEAKAFDKPLRAHWHLWTKQPPLFNRSSRLVTDLTVKNEQHVTLMSLIFNSSSQIKISSLNPNVPRTCLWI